jgi:hypothetical protein
MISLLSKYGAARRPIHRMSMQCISVRSTNDSDAPLRVDVKKLGKILGGCIKVQDEMVFTAVENLRALSKEVFDTS